jgi:hypothetical protein
MSRKTRQPSDAGLQSDTPGRRRVLKRLLIGIGASAIVQPNGGVFGLAFGQEKKEEGTPEGGKKKKGGKKKGDEEPKKE